MIRWLRRWWFDVLVYAVAAACTAVLAWAWVRATL